MTANPLHMFYNLKASLVCYKLIEILLNKLRRKEELSSNKLHLRSNF